MIERFDAYVARCLYDPDHGFYGAGQGSAGRRRGDFITSPEVGPLFATVLARVVDHAWDRLGRPDEVRVYDVGAGPGTLGRGLLDAPGPARNARTVVAIEHTDTLPDDLSGAVVVANELLDNLPFRIVERTAEGWHEVWVDHDGGAGPVEVVRPADSFTMPPGLDEVAPGTRVPILESAHRWVADTLARQPALVLAFDYGAATTVELTERGGWLRTYRGHQRGHDPYLDPGAWDLTTDVAVDQLPEPTDVVDQAMFLRRWGIDDLVDEGRRHWASAAARPDVEAFRMRSRVTEAEALCDPSGLGSWLVWTWDAIGVAWRW